MESKSKHIVKSKSSNSGVTTRSGRDNGSEKKSRSNAQFAPAPGGKKRGVYVEKKPTKICINAEQDPSPGQTRRPLKRPRRCGKRFLTSVLTILSKCTTGTQHPDPHDPKRKPLKTKPKRKNIKTADTTQETPKPRYKSKYLNEDFTKLNQEKVVVLKSNKKEIIVTPSVASETSKESHSNSNPKDTKPDEVTNVEQKYDGIAGSVLAGKTLKKNLLKHLIEEPNTQVSMDNFKDQNGLYNFFVDLLETTFSVYNVKAEYDAAPTPKEISTSQVLEIDQTVADKLNISKTECEPKVEIEFKPKYEVTVDHLLPERRKQKKTFRRKKTESFIYPTYTSYQIDSPKTQSVVDHKFPKKNKKRTLLNMIKQELSMDEHAFEEPQNLYQALKQMARNKRKCQRAIRFDDILKREKNHGSDYSECMFKRRKVISSSTKSEIYKKKFSCLNSTIELSIPTNSLTRNFSESTETLRKTVRTDYSSGMDEEIESNHSLEVYEYDFENSPVKSQSPIKKQEVVFTYHSTPESSCDLNFINNVLSSASATSSIKQFSSLLKPRQL